MPASTAGHPATTRAPAGELTTTAGYCLIDQVAGFGRPYPILVLTGGDCLLRPDLFDLTDYAVSSGVPVCLSPSVTPLLNAEMIGRIAASGVKAVSVSLDSARAPRRTTGCGASPGTSPRPPPRSVTLPRRACGCRSTRL